MIPQYKGVLRREVNINDLIVPQKIRGKEREKKLRMFQRLLSTQDGMVCNHDYTDMRGDSWRQYTQAFDTEKKVIEYADKNSKTIREFEKILEGISNSEDFDLGALDGLDVGIASLTIALSATGCAPISSCRSHPNSTYVDRPTVAFFAGPQIARKLLRLTKDMPIGLFSDDIEQGYNGILVFSNSIISMMDYGQKLYKNLGH